MEKMTTIDLTDLMKLEKYYRISLINKISGVKSANLIGTQSTEGVSNLAIFNSVIHIGANPPYLGFITRPLSVERHTYSNIKAIKYFTINQVSIEIHKKAHLTSAKFPEGVSEFSTCGLSEMFIDDFPVPFVGESKIKIGLSFQEEHLIKANNTLLVIGRIEKLILPESAVRKDGDLNFETLDSVGVGGLDSYYSCKRLGKYEYARISKNITE